ncbi:MAG TPA: acyclic terpene utilization AtuA family protein [Bryobacteraceae bacterium]|nr:acyclic terpene utilization AtuA family protein [Bryobacteraceae bacterium]
MIRIANGQGFWGDSLEAPLEQIRRGPLDYLTLDYLAEVTMSILQKQRSRDPRAGYARDFVEMIGRGALDIASSGLKIVANAGGVNPDTCREAVAKAINHRGTRIGVVSGDNILDRLDDLIGRGVALKSMDTGEPLESIRSRVQSANVYFGGEAIAYALAQGAQIVITGRTTDTGLVLGPMMYEFGWKADEWDKLAAGTIAGHTVECGAQCTGGNCQVDWQTIPDMASIGYPIVEAEPDGTFVITKHPGTGGRITVASIKEQLLYEMGDPREYITPDCIADFTSIQLEQVGPDRVRFSGIRGKPSTDFYKVSISYSAGFKAIGALMYSWPDAYAKAKAADAILRQRLDRLGLRFDAVRTEFGGVNACHGSLAGEPAPDIAEVMLRVGVRSNDRAAVERFTKEIAPLALNGPPTVTGLGSGRPKVEEIVAYWPALIPKTEASPEISVEET